MQPIDPRELFPDKGQATRYLEWLWPELSRLRRPLRSDGTEDPPKAPVLDFVLKSEVGTSDIGRIVHDTLDGAEPTLTQANVWRRDGVYLRVNAETEGVFVGRFAGKPRNRLYGLTEAAWPLAPSVETTISSEGRAAYGDVTLEAVWRYTGKLSDEQHSLIAERLQRFNAVNVVTRGIVDLRLPGWYSQHAVGRPIMVTSVGAQHHGTAAPLYPAAEINQYICARLRQAFDDNPYAA